MTVVKEKKSASSGYCMSWFSSLVPSPVTLTCVSSAICIFKLLSCNLRGTDQMMAWSPWAISAGMCFFKASAVWLRWPSPGWFPQMDDWWQLMTHTYIYIYTYDIESTQIRPVLMIFHWISKSTHLVAYGRHEWYGCRRESKTPNSIKHQVDKLCKLFFLDLSGLGGKEEYWTVRSLVLVYGLWRWRQVAIE